MYATDEIKTAIQALQQAHDALKGDSDLTDIRDGISDLQDELECENEDRIEDMDIHQPDEAKEHAQMLRNQEMQAAKRKL